MFSYAGFVTSLMDQVPEIRHALGKYSREIFSGIICTVSFILGLVFVTEGGIYVFQIFDYYVARYTDP